MKCVWRISIKKLYITLTPTTPTTHTKTLSPSFYKTHIMMELETGAKLEGGKKRNMTYQGIKNYNGQRTHFRRPSVIILACQTIEP